MTILNATGEPFAEAFQNALNSFVGDTHSALKSAGKTPAVWEGGSCCCRSVHGAKRAYAEMVLDFNLTLADDTLVLSVMFAYVQVCSCILTIVQCLDLLGRRQGCCRQGLPYYSCCVQLLLSGVLHHFAHTSTLD